MREIPSPRGGGGDQTALAGTFLRPRWGCLCAGEERRQGWRHSLACPVRAPGWRIPARYEPYGLVPEPPEEAGGPSAAQREAWQLREAGLTWRQVGERLGISPQLARHRGLRGAAARG
jgi:hypothetical protein